MDAVGDGQMPLEGLADDAGVGWDGRDVWWRRGLFKS
jgi:hypothetical protein